MSLTPIPSPQSISPIDELVEMLARLRHPLHGSAWEREQTSLSIANNMLEEAYEAVDAIMHNDMPELKGELGDVLLQVVFHSQIAKENGHFGLNEVAAHVVAKLKARLPYFFSGQQVSTEEQLKEWEAIKNRERAQKGHTSVLDGVAKGLPALMRATKLQDRAARIGYTWPTPTAAIGKVDEEWAEVKEAITEGDKAHIEEEVGDAMLALSNLARMLGVDAEIALTKANGKFERRFRHVEAGLAVAGITPEGATLGEMVRLWNEAKTKEISK